MAMKTARCWEKFQCGKHDCPAYGATDSYCWLISGTHCRDEIQGTFVEKMEACLDCEFFQENAFADRTVVEETLRFVVRKLRERCEELAREEEALNKRVQEIKALNKLFAQHLEREREIEQARIRLVDQLRILLEPGFIPESGNHPPVKAG
jgi:hypothetical protein